MASIVAIIAVALGGLVLWLWPSEAGEQDPWVTVFQTGDAGEIALIKSLFKQEEIPLLVKGEGVQDLFGMGRLGTGYNFITGPVLIQVPESIAQRAEDLLKEMEKELGHA